MYTIQYKKYRLERILVYIRGFCEKTEMTIFNHQ